MAADAGLAFWPHVIEPGDTLIGLRDRLMLPGSDWRVLRRLNRVGSTRRLVPGAVLQIPVSMMRLQPQSVEVLHRHGQVLLQRGDAAPQALSSPAVLNAGDWIVTGPQSSIALRFADGVHVLVGPDSRLLIERHARLGGDATLDTRVRLQSGAADVQVPAVSPPPRFELRTPVVNLGVRGTEFRGRIDGARVFTEVERGHVAAGPHVVAAGFGAVADTAGVAAPRPLLPLPDLAMLPPRVERVPLVLAFAASGGAVGYRARVFATEPAEVLLLDGVFEQPLASWATDLADGAYELRVRAIDAMGLEGREARAPFQLKARPEPPLLMRPRDEEVFSDTTVVFAWSGHAEASRYRLQVAATADFAQPLLDREDLAVTRFSMPLPLGIWHWRLASVRADGDQGPWSDVRTLQRIEPPPPPAAPPIEAPRSSRAGVLLSWSRSALPDVRYQVQVARDPGFEQLVLDVSVTETEVLLDKPAPGRYLVRIRALDAQGRAGPYGAVQTVEVPRSFIGLWLLPLLLLLL